MLTTRGFNGPFELLKHTIGLFKPIFQSLFLKIYIYIYIFRSLSSENPFNQTEFNFITEFSNGKGAYGPNCERKDSLNPKI